MDGMTVDMYHNDLGWVFLFPTANINELLATVNLLSFSTLLPASIVRLVTQEFGVRIDSHACLTHHCNPKIAKL